MAEDIFPVQSSQDNTVQSSQESDLLSQESFNMLWKSITESTLSACAMNFMNDLDSTNITNETDEQQLLGEEPSIHRQFTSNDNITASVQLPTQIPTVGSNIQSSALPACETWNGDYDFTVSFSPQSKSTKGVAWTYSAIKDKLYVGKDAPCPVNFSVNTRLPSDVYIRVMALYTSPEQVSEIVKRCVNHSVEEIKLGRVEAEHLIRCESNTATYHTDASGRHSVVVPFENPPAGQKYSTYIYKFACFGSCSGGPNRRPLMLIFTLEAGGEVIGRRKMDVKICACPGRDRKTEEAQCLTSEIVSPPTHNPVKRKLSEYVTLSETMEFTKSVHVSLPKKKKPNIKEGLYNVNTDDRQLYDFLVQMKRFYEMCKMMNNLPPEIMNVAQQNLHKFKTEGKD